MHLYSHFLCEGTYTLNSVFGLVFVLLRYQTVLHTRAFPFGFRSGTSAVSCGAVISPYMTGGKTVMVAASGRRLTGNYREAPVSASAINGDDPQCQKPRP